MTRRAGEPGENLRLRRSLRPTNNPLANRRGVELSAIEDEDDEPEEAEEQVMGESIQLADGFGEIEQPLPDEILQVSTLPKATKEKVVIAPIKWMKGERPFTIQDALTGPATQLQISLPQLLDCSPRLR